MAKNARKIAGFDAEFLFVFSPFYHILVRKMKTSRSGVSSPDEFLVYPMLHIRLLCVLCF